MDKLKDSLNEMYIWQNHLPDPVREVLQKYNHSPQTDDDIKKLSKELESLGYNRNHFKKIIPFNIDRKSSKSRMVLIVMLFVYTAVSILIAYYSQIHGH